jgi:L-threonylcarbamoyladenylate synthase
MTILETAEQPHYTMIVNTDNAIALLNQNEVVAIPTETVYGLAGKIDSELALEKIFKTKERPYFDPLIVHSYSIQELEKYTAPWNKVHYLLAKKFWPGPMTLIIKKNQLIHHLITAGLESVGVRIPNHPLTLELLKKIKTPLAAPSANKFTKVSPTKAQHVEDEFDGKIPVIDGGYSEVGIESTVIDVIEIENKFFIKIYRPGKISSSEIAQFLNSEKINFEISYEKSPVAPGQIKHHYMPKVPLIVIDQDLSLESVKLENINRSNIQEIKLSHDPLIASRELYHELRVHAELGATALLIKLSKNVKNNDQWSGILNRLEKAATVFLI